MITRLAFPLVLASLLGISAAAPSLAQEEGPPEPGLGGRIELPEAGYALTVPDDWVAIVPSSAEIDVIIENLGTIDLELATTVENALAGGVGFSLLAFGDIDADSGFRENCNVIDGASDGASLAVIVESEAAAFADLGDRLASGPDVTDAAVPLRGGRQDRLRADVPEPRDGARGVLLQRRRHPSSLDLHQRGARRRRLAQHRRDLRDPARVVALPSPQSDVPLDRDAPRTTLGPLRPRDFDGDTDLVAFVQGAVGYSLTGEMTELVGIETVVLAGVGGYEGLAPVESSSHPSRSSSPGGATKSACDITTRISALDPA